MPRGAAEMRQRLSPGVADLGRLHDQVGRGAPVASSFLNACPRLAFFDGARESAGAASPAGTNEIDLGCFEVDAQRP